MRAQHPGIALSACVLGTFVACSQAFTSGGAGDGGGDASSDSPGAGDDSSGGDAVVGDASGDAGRDGIAIDAVAHDGPPPHDAPSSEGAADAGGGDGVVGSAKLVFITGQVFTGDLGGLPGADTLCGNLAAAASRPGTFKAWLSSTAISASQRLTHSTGPYVLVDGTEVAADWAGLTSGTLLHPIDITEKGGPAPVPGIMCSANVVSAAWTSTAANGTLATTLKATCSDWTTAGISNGAILGVVGQTNSTWTDGCGSQTSAGNDTICAQTASLYCFEQ